MGNEVKQLEARIENLEAQLANAESKLANLAFYEKALEAATETLADVLAPAQPLIAVLLCSNIDLQALKQPPASAVSTGKMRPTCRD